MNGTNLFHGLLPACCLRLWHITGNTRCRRSREGNHPGPSTKGAHWWGCKPAVRLFRLRTFRLSDLSAPERRCSKWVRIEAPPSPLFHLRRPRSRLRDATTAAAC